MKSTLIQGVIIILIYCIAAAVSFWSTIDAKSKNNTMKFNVVYLIVGLVGTAFSLIVAVILTLSSHEALSWIMIAFSALSVLLVIAYFQCRIFCDNEKFIIRNFFGKKKIILYSEITDIKNGIDTMIFTKDTSVKIPNYMIGRYEFFVTLVPYLSEKIGKRAEKASENPPVRSFRDAVWRSGEMIFVYVLLYVVIIGLFIACLCVSNGKPGLWLSAIAAIVWTFFIFISVHSAKRAHSSTFWEKIAKHCFKNGYLNLNE